MKVNLIRQIVIFGLVVVTAVPMLGNGSRVRGSERSTVPLLPRQTEEENKELEESEAKGVCSASRRSARLPRRSATLVVTPHDHRVDSAGGRDLRPQNHLLCPHTLITQTLIGLLLIPNPPCAHVIR